MFGGYTYMTEERMRALETESVVRYSELKKRRTSLSHALEGWAANFTQAASRIRGNAGHLMFDMAKLPEKAEVVAAWDESKEVNKEIRDLQTFFHNIGLLIE